MDVCERPRSLARILSSNQHHLVISSVILLTLLIMTLKSSLYSQRSPASSSSSSRHKYLKDSHYDRKEKGPKRRTIYVVTPTYPRANQIPEMTRLAQTLMLVSDIHWIVCEDTRDENTLLLDYLLSTGLIYTYIRSPMPSQMRRWRVPPVGVSGRRAGLAWIRNNVKTGVVYFADDDNTYDYRIFEEIRSTKNVSMFPVGFVTNLQLSTPIVKYGKFTGWYDGWIADRRFPVDMGTFAFSVELLQKRPRANMAWTYSYQEESILASLGVKPEDIEFKADGCTKIWVWHTKSVKPELASRDILLPLFDDTNLRALQEQLFIKSLKNENDMIKRSINQGYNYEEEPFDMQQEFLDPEGDNPEESLEEEEPLEDNIVPHDDSLKGNATEPLSDYEN